MLDKISTVPKFRVRLYIALIILVVAVIIVPSISELLVALHNRFQVYPVGTDTSMLASTLIIEFILLGLLITGLMHWFVGLRTIKAVLITLVLIGLMGWLVMIYGFPSALPQSWCAQELRIYSCEQFKVNPQWESNGIL